MAAETPETYLAPGLPAPRPTKGIDDGYWEATLRHELVVQQCKGCNGLQWEPEAICHRCHSFELGWRPVSGRGRIYTWERVWHPVHNALRESCPYLVAVVELPDAGDVRMAGNLLGDPLQDVAIGVEVEAVFEDHTDEQGQPYTLVQWRVVS
jgi:uncharacterized OB-fold protein